MVVEVLAADAGGSCSASVERRAVVIVDGRASAATFSRLPRGRCCRAVVRRLERQSPPSTGAASGAAAPGAKSGGGLALSPAEKNAVAKLGPYAASKARAAAAAAARAALAALAAAAPQPTPPSSGGVAGEFGESGGVGGGLGAWAVVQASAPLAFVSPAAPRLEWLPPASLYAPGPVAVTLLWEDCPGVRGWEVKEDCFFAFASGVGGGAFASTILKMYVCNFTFGSHA